LAWLTISGRTLQAVARHASPLWAENAKTEKLTGGFFNISGGAVDSAGDIYFVDAHWQTIYRWSTSRQQVSKVRDNPLDPVSLFFDKAGNVNVVSYAGSGTVYSFKPDGPDDDVTLLPAVPVTARPGATAVLPVDYWRNENDFLDSMSAKKPFQYVSLDGTTFFPAAADFVNGELYYGSKLDDPLRAFGFAPADPKYPFYVSDENGEKTYAATVGADGQLTTLRLFAEQGGESVAVDEKGNVYIASGQVYVYDSNGNLIDTIDVPERPSQLLFGGKDRNTLFILARTSLYAVRTSFKGR
jgi:sugar lactone lactonase YvrE